MRELAEEIVCLVGGAPRSYGRPATWLWREGDRRMVAELQARIGEEADDGHGDWPGHSSRLSAGEQGGQVRRWIWRLMGL